MKMSKTYYDNILENLSTEVPMEIETLMQHMNLPDYKISYVIDGIKKGIKKNTILKISNPTEKRLYLGHSYIKWN